MKCRKCGSGNMGVMPNKKNPSATDLYCLDCGAWQKFATKDEIRLYQCKKESITNADRIRAMSDDDMADTMCRNPIFTVCDAVCKGDCKAVDTLNDTKEAVCKRTILDWLQQLYEGE